MTEPTASSPWTVTLAWCPDQNFRRVSIMPRRTPVYAIFELFSAGEDPNLIRLDYELTEEQLGVLYQLHLEQQPDLHLSLWRRLKLWWGELVARLAGHR